MENLNEIIFEQIEFFRISELKNIFFGIPKFCAFNIHFGLWVKGYIEGHGSKNLKLRVIASAKILVASTPVKYGAIQLLLKTYFKQKPSKSTHMEILSLFEYNPVCASWFNSKLFALSILSYQVSLYTSHKKLMLILLNTQMFMQFSEKFSYQ